MPSTMMYNFSLTHLLSWNIFKLQAAVWFQIGKLEMFES